jgi:hypothetical protein
VSETDTSERASPDQDQEFTAIPSWHKIISHKIIKKNIFVVDKNEHARRRSKRTRKYKQTAFQ